MQRLVGGAHLIEIGLQLAALPCALQRGNSGSFRTV